MIFRSQASLIHNVVYCEQLCILSPSGCVCMYVCMYVYKLTGRPVYFLGIAVAKSTIIQF